MLGRNNALIRRANIYAAGVADVTPLDYQRLFNRYDGECAYCHVQLGDSFDWDHVVPVSRGGRHSVGNLVPACQTCNRSKGAKLLVEWRRGLTVL